MTATTVGLPDLHAELPRIALPVESVGHVGVKRLICVGQPAQPAMVVLDVLVGLRAEQRGAHMSRLIRCLDVPSTMDSVRQYVSAVFAGLRRLTPEVASWRIRARAVMTLPVDGGLKPIEEICELSALAGQAPVLTWGAAFRVCLACPQAQAVIAHDRDDLAGLGGHPSHNQICDLEIAITGDPELAAGQTASGLLALGEEAASGPVREFHKRRGEGDVVAAVHRNALFAEDALRGITAKVRADFPDAAQVRTEILNHESIFEYPLRCVVVG
jgi:GTP cyclohydrolase FolE2